MTPVTPPETIRTERLLLRLWRETDAPMLKTGIDANLEHLRAWVPWAMHEPSSLQAIEERIGRFQRSFKGGTEWLYAVLSADESALYGGAGLHARIGAGALEIGYWLQQAWVGNGYATEAVQALTAAAFSLPAIERVEIRCDPRNTKSAAIPKRLGFRHETTMHNESATPSGAPRDTMVWALTRQKVAQSARGDEPRRTKNKQARGRAKALLTIGVAGVVLLGAGAALHPSLPPRTAAKVVRLTCPVALPSGSAVKSFYDRWNTFARDGVSRIHAVVPADARSAFSQAATAAGFVPVGGRRKELRVNDMPVGPNAVMKEAKGRNQSIRQCVFDPTGGDLYTVLIVR